MPFLRKDYITNKISLSTYLVYLALKYKDSRACPSRIYSPSSNLSKTGGGSRGCPPGNAFYYSIIYSPRSDYSKVNGGLGGIPLEVPPSKDKTISHGLDVVEGNVAFFVGFQVVLKPEKYN
jgi:hypothetical protein